MALIKCKECGNEFSSKAKSCPKCGNPHKQSSSGCLLLIIIGIVVVIVFAIFSSNTTSSVSDPDMRKPTIGINQISGTYISNSDSSWKCTVTTAPSSGGAYGGWNGTIRLYGPHPDYDGSPFRCRVFGDILTVELITNGETSLIKMFDIIDANTMRCTIPNYWPGTLLKQY